MSNVINMNNHKTELFLRDLQTKAGNTIFKIGFFKKNGDYRELKGRFGVRKGLKGKGLAYSPIENGMFTIYDVENGGFRTVTIDNIRELSIRGKKYQFTAW